jgi:hypothetical protein
VYFNTSTVLVTVLTRGFGALATGTITGFGVGTGIGITLDTVAIPFLYVLTIINFCFWPNADTPISISSSMYNFFIVYKYIFFNQK